MEILRFDLRSAPTEHFIHFIPHRLHELDNAVSFIPKRADINITVNPAFITKEQVQGLPAAKGIPESTVFQQLIGFHHEPVHAVLPFFLCTTCHILLIHIPFLIIQIVPCFSEICNNTTHSQLSKA